MEKAECETIQYFDPAVKKSRKMIEKSFYYKLEQLKIKRERLNSNLLRKSGMINDMMYSFVNACPVWEDMEEFNDLIKLLTLVSEEYQQLVTNEDLQLNIIGLKSKVSQFSASNTRYSSG